MNVERFWSKVDVRGPNECWDWKAAVRPNGYGVFSVGRLMKRAHRLAWEIENGAIPTGDGFHGTVVMHTCDNRKCCNPAHLKIGTQAENLADMRAKNRDAAGERTYHARLTNEQVKTVRHLWFAERRTSREIGAFFSVPFKTVERIVARPNSYRR